MGVDVSKDFSRCCLGLVVSLFPPFVFCGGPVFPCVAVLWSFGGLGFWVVIVLLV